jgi:hypothetical protein
MTFIQRAHPGAFFFAVPNGTRRAGGALGAKSSRYSKSPLPLRDTLP